MVSTVANMNGNSITTGWIVEFLRFLGDFFKYQKNPETFPIKKTQLGKNTGFMRNPSLTPLPLTPTCHQNPINRNF